MLGRTLDQQSLMEGVVATFCKGRGLIFGVNARGSEV